DLRGRSPVPKKAPRIAIESTAAPAAQRATAKSARTNGATEAQQVAVAAARSLTDTTRNPMNSLPSTAAAASHAPRPLPRLGAGNPSTPAQSPAWRFRAVACAGLLLALSPAEGATFRWASSSNRIYVENGGTATLSDIKGALPNAP